MSSTRIGLMAATALAVAACSDGSQHDDAIVLASQGSLAVAGRVIGDPAGPSLHCDHGFAEFQIPVDAKSTNLLLWHSASVAAWQNRWDGGEGFQSIFLKRGYPVYLWDGPRVGRADWGCEAHAYEPAIGQDQRNWTSWRLGPQFGEWFDGVQFPRDNQAAWTAATRARYVEYDTIENIHLQAAAGAVLADQIGPSVAVTNSAGGLRALLAATQSDNIKGVVAYENVGFVFPPGRGPDVPQGPYGPIEVSEEAFMRLTEIPLQMVWGDNVEAVETFASALVQSRLFADLINEYGGNAEVLLLSDAGLHGNTHIPFADMNNVAVADLLSEFLEANDLAD